MLDTEVIYKLRVEGLARNKIKMFDVTLGVEIKVTKLRRNAKVVVEGTAAACGRKRIQLSF